MTQPDIIQTILKDSNYHLDLFKETEVQDLRQKVEGNDKPVIYCDVRRKAVQLKPEEVVRQLYAARLLKQFRYDPDRVRFEHSVNFGREKKRADIVILDKDRPDTPYIIVEVKKPKLQDGKDQLRSYCNAIREYPGGWDTLGNLGRLKDSNFSPDAETEYKYIELSNIGRSGEIAGSMVEQGQDLPSRARRKVAVGDIIVSSVEGSLDRIALITEEYDNTLCSTGFHVIRSDVFNSETLLALLKSSIGQLQLKKGCSGTILIAINKEEFSTIAVPKIREEKQSEIEQKVLESFNRRKRAKDLLEHAKRAVEIAIEQGEQAAIDWLEAVSEVVNI